MTWVPPAYRRPGDERPPKSRAWLPVGGIVATVVAVLGALFFTAGVSWLDSVCNDTAAVVAAHRSALRLHVIVVWLVAAGVPAFFGGLARVHRRAWVPWFCAAGALVGVGLGVALAAQPPTWCLF